jgi:hypothetical protein
MRTIRQFNRWLRPTANTRTKSWVVSALAVFALLLIPLSATSASASAATVTHASTATVTHASTFTQPLTIQPHSDGGCDQTTAKNGSAIEFCFYIHGSGNYIDPMYADWCNGGPNTVEGHAEITGPSGDFDGNTYTLASGHCTPEAPEVCPSGCDVLSGTYEGIFWQYYGGNYYNVAQQFDVVG